MNALELIASARADPEMTKILSEILQARFTRDTKIISRRVNKENPM
jgi:hypothetical protein